MKGKKDLKQKEENWDKKENNKRKVKVRKVKETKQKRM